MEGRVEVCHNQIWWAVSAWLLLLAGTGTGTSEMPCTVVCRHLHYSAN